MAEEHGISPRPRQDGTPPARSQHTPPDTHVQATPPAAPPAAPANGPTHPNGVTGAVKAAARWFAPPTATSRNTSNLREILETVVFVVVLVLLLKTFAAEAFVIPTGSMATTLYGYQKYVTCPQCGYEFPVNCSEQVENNIPVVNCVCPNCRLPIDFRRDFVDQGKRPPEPNTGDRVLVAKALYDTGLLPPHRLDVVVFRYPKYPLQNYVATNYIKRLIGLPGETIGIYYGKLYVLERPPGTPPAGDVFFGKADGSTADEGREPLMPREGIGMEGAARGGRPNEGVDWAKDYDKEMRQFMHENEAVALLKNPSPEQVKSGRVFHIIRKPPAQVLAERRIVYDNDHQAADLTSLPPRWDAGKAAWTADPQDRHGFRHAGGAADRLDWLTYQHILRDGARDADGHPIPELITDFIGYNTGNAGRQGPPPPNWVGDLMLECDVQVGQSQGELVLELSKGVDRFRARWDLASGECSLVRRTGDVEKVLDRQPTPLGKPGSYHVRFANVDERLLVWVDRKLPFGDGVQYDAPAQRGPRKTDLQPARIGVQGAAVGVRHLQLWRDTYYTQEPGGADAGVLKRADSPSQEHGILADPEQWQPLRELDARTFYVQPHYFLCMGDNSPASSDGRQWGLVPERLMLGRALWVYYPFYCPLWPLNNPVNRFGPIK